MRDLDPFHPDRVAGDLPERLAAFNDAGVLSSADIHVARRLARLSGCSDSDALLAAAFAVRAPRYGHVFAQLDDLDETVTDEDGRVADLDPDLWPDDVAAWIGAISASPMVTTHTTGDAAAAGGTAAAGDSAADGAGDVVPRPLHLEGRRLYLDRYWRYEHRVAGQIRHRLDETRSEIVLEDDGRRALQDRIGDDPGQYAAALAALSTPFTVIAGGPGTGKTWVIAQTVAVATQHASRPDGQALRIAIAAPTGKAAARLGEQLRELHRPDHDGVDIQPTTLHRLLGWRPNRTRFRHDRANPLPYDLVIVDEVSMVALSMLSSLLDAVDDATHLVLVGDPDQLAAVEAGTVLGDLVVGADPDLGRAVVTLDRGYRFAGDITAFSTAVRDGDVDGALAQLDVNPRDLDAAPLALVIPDRPGEWPDLDPALAGVRQQIVRDSAAMVDHAAAGRAAAALDAAMQIKVLCAHRRGPQGVGVWNATIESWIHDAPAYRRPEWYPGRPVMVTGNNYDLGVYNGDIGVVVATTDGRLQVVIDGRQDGPVEYRRLGEIQTVHALTVHKSQGSQFERVVVVLPSEPSPVLTRELLYTAVTRAKRAVTIIGTAEVLADAITRPVSRASALPERLTGPL